MKYISFVSEVKQTKIEGQLDKIGSRVVKEYEVDDFRYFKDNLLIKGENLSVLHKLKEQFTGRVKLIYIDPPYNTGHDNFGYNDKRDTCDWFTFIKNRLEVAKELIKEDGSIFVQIDDNEQAYLKVLMDEIFGRKNFVCNVVWQRSVGVNCCKHFTTAHDFILVYAKNKEKWNINLIPRTAEQNKRYSNPDNDPRGVWSPEDLSAPRTDKNVNYEIVNLNGTKYGPLKNRGWRVSEKKYYELLKDNRIYFGIKGGNRPRRKCFLSEVKGGVGARTLWFNKDMEDEEELSKQDKKKWNMCINQVGKNELKELELEQLFMTPKPEKLLHRIIHLATNPGDIVLDFFAGSGTTGAVAHKMARQWINIEQLDYIKDITLERLKKVISGEDKYGVSKITNWQGGGSFIYMEVQ